MKGLIVFYSLEGHTKFIANIIADELGCDLLELKPEKEIPRTGFRKFLWGGKSVIFKEKPRLKNKTPNLKEYDTIFIGTPIWASTYAPPVDTFITDNEIKGKSVLLFASHAGGGAEKCFEKLKIVLNGNKVIGTADFIDSNDEKEKQDKVKKWLSNINIVK